jgi:UDP-N-acetylglucosamine 4,6-dehydratase/5-epimerase
VVRACVDCGVERAMLVSTDKAVDPTTAYGATKQLAERIFIHGNAYGGADGPALMCVRYGNVIASQGSVIELWRHQSERGLPVTMTDPSITRFWWTVQDAARFVYDAMQYGNAGDILVPLMPSCSLGELADVVAPNVRRIRVDGYETEKRDEVLLAAHETARATYVHGFNAIRVSYLRPPSNERLWGSGRLCSADHMDLDGVVQALGGIAP